MDQAAPPQSKAKYNSEIEATITRADGTVESLGIIDAHYSNPLRQFVWLAFKRPASRRRIRAANRSAARKAA